MPRSHIPVRHPVWSRFSTNDRTSIKTPWNVCVNYSKCHLWAFSANLLPYTHRQWGSHGAGMAFITHPWRKHSDMTPSQSHINYVSPDQPPSFAIPPRIIYNICIWSLIPPRTSPVDPDLNPIENDCATASRSPTTVPDHPFLWRFHPANSPDHSRIITITPIGMKRHEKRHRP